MRRQYIRGTGPAGSHIQGETLAALISGTRKGIDGFTLINRNLAEDVCCRAKPVDTYASGLCRLTHPVCPKANEACTHQRRCMEIIVRIGNV